jgi:hypothetical protein
METEKVWIITSVDSYVAEPYITPIFYGVHKSAASAKVEVMRKWEEFGYSGNPFWYFAEGVYWTYDGNGFKWVIQRHDLKGMEMESSTHLRSYVQDWKYGIKRAAIIEKDFQPSWYVLRVGIYRDEGGAHRTISETRIRVTGPDLDRKFLQACDWVNNPNADRLPSDFASTVESYRPQDNPKVNMSIKPNKTLQAEINDRLLTIKQEMAEIEKILEEANE